MQFEKASDLAIRSSRAERRAISSQQAGANMAFRMAASLCFAMMMCGCTSFQDYVHNGFKIGPNYERPPAPVAKNWIDADDVRVRSETDDISKWWTVFNDPALDSLICLAYQQNLTLREAAFRVLAARDQLAISVGNLFPQTQTMNGSYTRNAISLATANSSFFNSGKRWYQQLNYNFNVGWEIDFWGRLRRAIESNEATLDASVEDYDDVLVTLLGEVATTYIDLRTIEQRLEFTRTNVALQEATLKIVQGGVNVKLLNELDLDQAKSTLEQTQAEVPELEIAARLLNNQLCVLLGISMEDLHARIGAGHIPTAPIDVAVGIPAELLRRRPDIRRAERLAAAQSAQIGVAEGELYPIISFSGTLGWSSQYIGHLITEPGMAGSLGPAFTWNVLNYGRILNNVRVQDARFQELVATYQNTVLAAQQDVENGLIRFIRAQTRTKLQAQCVVDAEKAVKIALAQYTAGVIDLTRVTLLQQTLVQQQDTLAQAQGEIGDGLVQVYKALGGGWQIRLNGGQPGPLPPTTSGSATPAPSTTPSPAPGADKSMSPAPVKPPVPSTDRAPTTGAMTSDGGSPAPFSGARRITDLFR